MTRSGRCALTGARRGLGEGLDGAEAVSAAQEARAGHATFAGVPTIVWTNRPAGSHPPGGAASVQTFAQAATRTG